MTLVALHFRVNKGDDVTHWFRNGSDAFKAVASSNMIVVDDYKLGTRKAYSYGHPAITMSNAVGQIDGVMKTTITNMSE